MMPVNKLPITVDFNNRDIDGAVTLNLPCATNDLEKFKISLSEGLILNVSDGEISMQGVVTFRKPFWVLIPRDTEEKTAV